MSASANRTRIPPRLAFSKMTGTLLPSRRLVTALVVSSVIGGFGEAAALVLLAQVAVALSARHGALVVSLSIAGRVSVTWALIGCLVAIVIKLVMDVIGAVAVARLGAMTLEQLRERTLASFLTASWSAQAADSEGFLQEVCTTHVFYASNASALIATGLALSFNLVALVVSSFVVSPVAAVAIFVVAGALFFAFRPLSTLSRRYSEKQREANIEYASVVSQASGLAREIRTFAVEPKLQDIVSQHNSAVVNAQFWAQLLSTLLPGVYECLALLLVVLALAGLYGAGVTGLASLGAVVLLVVRALLYSRTIQATYNNTVRVLPFVEQLQDVTELYRASAEPDGTLDLARIDTLQFDGVGYSYVPDQPALVDVSFSVRRGEAIGIVGPSGAGKSTLMQLLLRLRVPSRGRYLVNGQSASEFRTAAWYRTVAVLPQEPRLLDGTIAENIRFLRDDVDDDAIQRAARLAQIHDEIVSWPLGYDTPVGPRGVAISGGQRQRVCLARALATRPSVLVLDEPTSALDVHSETAIQQALEATKGETTLFIVAHRLSTLNICDRIIVLEDGQLRAFAPAEDLMRTSAYFSRAVELSRLP
jgi:ABC-type multidrug transport system fused ATPase/permease subunit